MRADQATSRETTTLTRVRHALGSAVVVYDGPGCVPPPTATLAIHVAAAADDLTPFGRWARSARLPAVTLTFDGERILVGPLSVPGRPGCAECARRRMLAAKAASFGAVAPQVAHLAVADSPMGVALRRPAAKARTSAVPGASADDPDRTSAVARSVVLGADDDPERTTDVANSLIVAADDDVERTTAVPRSVVVGVDDDVERTTAVARSLITAADDDDVERTAAVSGLLYGRITPPVDPDKTTVVPDDLTERSGSHGSYAGSLELPDPQADRVVALLRSGARDLVDHVAEVVDGEVVWHRVIPLPSCDVCGGAEGIGAVGLPEGDDPAALLEALAGWVDPLTGVIPWISLKQPLGTGPDLPFVATAAPPHHVDTEGRARALPIGWGKGATQAEAILSAVGEAIERYAPSLPEAEKLVWARPADLAGDILDPREFPLYEPESYARPGFAFAAFDRRTDHPWVRGTWLGTDRPVWVPAVFTYLAMTLLPEHLICQGTSNGLAAGTDAESATVRAVLELIERDAMMAAWLTGAKGRYVELDDTLDPDLAAIVEALRTQGVTVEVYLLPTSMYGVTAAALALGDGKRRPGATLGLGADRSPRAAIRAAVLELAQTASHLAGLMRERPVPKGPEEVREMLDHAAYYFPLDRVAAFDRLRCGGTSRLRDLREPVAESSVTDLAHVLGSAKVRVAVVDVTSADVATGPFRVVRAVSPDLQPISYGYGNDRSVVARLRGRTLSANRTNIHPIW
ncbi:thiazole/oxazole-forming peptide maturase, SagD family component [Actinokineospora alba]|uniref:Thiazole/oxazole-forming peptide maturase, SagD family component n=1 Tax=Actinokineospora alba TaxID=504798 RepID=A0A1H0WEW9_9PSEU|nr:YcaO-like family protein [Actinokineospora alba]TDP68922.1 thiazole/oxazole-forming peptide maturase SagD family component [Actinokineospora alba]SDI75277.1 thiazole/oxazole-forming peptide maturase, SagD family component [Actinokineospora alba]SDP89091.1 thiazole/oxazole-forming peptide maturase, SagD family component [Actinokineospora alba]